MYPQGGIGSRQPPGMSVGSKNRKMISKGAANYRPAIGPERCGNCVMFHPSQSASAIQLAGRCDLVLGEIYAKDTCDHWEAK